MSLTTEAKEAGQEVAITPLRSCDDDLMMLGGQNSAERVAAMIATTDDLLAHALEISLVKVALYTHHRLEVEPTRRYSDDTDVYPHENCIAPEYAST